MSPEKGRAGETPPPITIESADIREAFSDMARALKNNPAGSVRNAQPDSLIAPGKECTPNKEAALADFKAIEASLAEAHIDIHAERVLEIGSGMGELLAVFRANDVDAIGIDYTPRDSRRSEGVVGIINAPLGALKAEKIGHFGIILAKNVFDNDRYAFQIYRDMLSQIDALLKTGGVFLKIGTGKFAPEDIPNNWEKLQGGNGYGLELYRKS